MPPKSRVGVRLKEAIGGSKSINRSADLDALKDRFNTFRTKLKNLIISLKSHHEAMQQVAKARMEVADNIGLLTEKTALHECGGLLPTPENSAVVSYRSVHMDFSRRAGAYADKYNQYIVEYAMEWDKIINNRVSKGIRDAEALRRDLDHYQGKVESLRQSTNKTLANGKQVKAETAERLSRNEEKLIKSKEEYNKFATDMCILIEEVTDRAWKDLHPMLVKLAQFDSTKSSDEAKALSALNDVVNQLKKLADQHGLTPQARLKDLAERRPSEITTAKSGGGLALESGGSYGSGIMGGSGGITGSIYDGENPSMAPGAVSPQGIGGLPVQIASETNGERSLSRVSSQNSFGSGSYNNYNMTTSDMLAVSAAAAPPPSFDQVQDATASMSLGNRPRTASGNSFPPLAPSASGGGLYRRSSSILSSDDASMSSYGGPPAPAPAAPPPPPPTSGGLSMYSNYDGNDSLPVATALPSAPEPSYGAPPPYAAPSPPAHPWSTDASAPPFAAPAPTRRPSTNPFDG